LLFLSFGAWRIGGRWSVVPRGERDFDPSIAAAVLTPSTNPPPMLFFMGVMTGIYVISIGVAMVFGRKRKEED